MSICNKIEEASRYVARSEKSHKWQKHNIVHINIVVSTLIQDMFGEKKQSDFEFHMY